MNEDKLLLDIFDDKLLLDIFDGEYKPSERQIKMGDKNILIKFCGVCDAFYVECPRCGNNCCNAGYGQEIDGSDCIMCPKAYELQQILSKHFDLIEELFKNARTQEEREKHKQLNMRSL